MQASTYLAIFAIAAERWVLTERLVKADVFRKSEWFKTTLLSSMSHDLRTPLSVISASAGSLLRYGDSLPADGKQDLLETIEQQASRLNQLTSKLMSLSRIEGGLSQSSMPEIDALEVLGTALVSIRQLAPARTILKDLELTVAPVRADASLLEQVIFNVLENATVHTPSDTPVHVVVRASDDTLVIAIEDYGPGVPVGQTEQVFERFHQAPPISQQRRGSGLGLSIARGFARAIGGDVVLVPVSHGRTGARFEIRLPLC
jgi:two-component system sensor histidine kinase KdpD